MASDSKELSGLDKDRKVTANDSNSSGSSTAVDARQDVEPVEICVPLNDEEDEPITTCNLIHNDIRDSPNNDAQLGENKSDAGMNVNPHHNTSNEYLQCSCGGEYLTHTYNSTADDKIKLTCNNCSKEKLRDCNNVPDSLNKSAENSDILHSKNSTIEESSVIKQSHVEPEIVITDLSSEQNHSKTSLDSQTNVHRDQIDNHSIASSFADTTDIEPILTQPLPMTATMSSYCPPGMEALLEVCQLVVHKGNFRRNIDISKTAVAKHEVVDISRKVVLFAEREPAPISAQSFLYKIYNADQLQVMEVYCPLGKTCVCCRATWHMCKCCQLQAMVSAPPGNIIGFIKRQHTRFVQEYHILNPLEELIFILRGGALDLEIYTPTLGDELGRVAVHNWHGIMHEMKRTGDDYGVTFPMDLDVRVKATLLGMAFVLDWIFTTNSGKR